MKSVNIIANFEKAVDTIYGVYLDSTSGFRELQRKIVNQQLASLHKLQKTNPKLATIEHLDHKAIIYGKGNHNNPESYELHRCTQLEYKERDSEGGLNFLFIGNMALVSIYQYWEDYYRAEISSLFGIPKNELKEPVMGDIR